MFREVREIKEVDELGIKEINEGKALIYIRSVVEYDKGYNNLNSDLKKYFSACINYLIKNIRTAIEYKKQININFRKIDVKSSNKKFISFKDFNKWYNRILNDLVYVDDFEEFEKLVNEFENTELDTNTL
jgi:hypothetical protein